MTETECMEKACAYVRELFRGDCSGHDYYHTMRVLQTARLLAKEEKADLFTVSLAAVLHDVDDRKLSPETWKNHANAVRFMRENGIGTSLIKEVCTIIDEVSFRGSDSVTPSTPEGCCVQDADRLDAIGAVGIARTFAYGGSHHRPMYDPEEAPDTGMDAETYYARQSHTVNHFYEKLLLLKDRMTTRTGRKLAADRHDFMVQFLEEFFAEWNAEK